MKVEPFADEKLTDIMRDILDLVRQLKGEDKKNARSQFANLLRKYDAWQLKFENQKLSSDLKEFETSLRGKIYG